jgi:hypothetical protein
MSLLETYKQLNFNSLKWDTYFDHYDKHLSRFVGKAPNVLEIGVGEGGSLELWCRYFENGKIFGIDANPECVAHEYNNENINVELGDQNSEEFWELYLKDKEKFDIIIDDGSHISQHQLTTMSCLFPHLKEGGLYIVEDTHTSYWPSWDGGFQKPGTYVETMKMMVDFLHRQHIPESQPSPQLTNIFDGLKSIQFYNSMVVLEKDFVVNMYPISSYTNS